ETEVAAVGESPQAAARVARAATRVNTAINRVSIGAPLAASAPAFMAITEDLTWQLWRPSCSFTKKLCHRMCAARPWYVALPDLHARVGDRRAICIGIDNRKHEGQRRSGTASVTSRRKNAPCSALRVMSWPQPCSVGVPSASFPIGREKMLGKCGRVVPED